MGKFPNTKDDKIWEKEEPFENDGSRILLECLIQNNLQLVYFVFRYFSTSAL